MKNYLKKLWKSKTVKAAMAQLLGIGLTYSQGQIDSKTAGALAAQAVIQILLRTITHESIGDK